MLTVERWCKLPGVTLESLLRQGNPVAHQAVTEAHIQQALKHYLAEIEHAYQI